MEPSLTYESAFNELQEINAAIESGNVSVDVLAAQVKRGAELAAFCKSMLRSAETELDKIIQAAESAA